MRGVVVAKVQIAGLQSRRYAINRRTSRREGVEKRKLTEKAMRSRK
jgi:hypothetical protein